MIKSILPVSRSNHLEIGVFLYLRNRTGRPFIINQHQMYFGKSHLVYLGPQTPGLGEFQTLRDPGARSFEILPKDMKNVSGGPVPIS
jgi:hypothetical protein